MWRKTSVPGSITTAECPPAPRIRQLAVETRGQEDTPHEVQGRPLTTSPVSGEDTREADPLARARAIGVRRRKRLRCTTVRLTTRSGRRRKYGAPNTTEDPRSTGAETHGRDRKIVRWRSRRSRPRSASLVGPVVADRRTSRNGQVRLQDLNCLRGADRERVREEASPARDVRASPNRSKARAVRQAQNAPVVIGGEVERLRSESTTCRRRSSSSLRTLTAGESLRDARAAAARSTAPRPSCDDDRRPRLGITSVVSFSDARARPRDTRRLIAHATAEPPPPPPAAAPTRGARAEGAVVLSASRAGESITDRRTPASAASSIAPRRTFRARTGGVASVVTMR